MRDDDSGTRLCMGTIEAKGCALNCAGAAADARSCQQRKAMSVAVSLDITNGTLEVYAFIDEHGRL